MTYNNQAISVISSPSEYLYLAPKTNPALGYRMKNQGRAVTPPPSGVVIGVREDIGR